MKTPLDAIYAQLTQIRNAFGNNLEEIKDCETKIHELKMHNIELQASIEKHEQSALILQKEINNV